MRCSKLQTCCHKCYLVLYLGCIAHRRSLVTVTVHCAADASEESSIAPLLSSEGDDDDDELPPDLNYPDASDSSSENDLAGMPELECGTEDELSSSGELSVSDDALPSLVGSSSGDEPPALESAEDEAGLWAGGSSGGESDEESDAPPGLVDCDSEVDSMPGEVMGGWVRTQRQLGSTHVEQGWQAQGAAGQFAGRHHSVCRHGCVRSPLCWSWLLLCTGAVQAVCRSYAGG